MLLERERIFFSFESSLHYLFAAGFAVQVGGRCFSAGPVLVADDIVLDLQ